MTCKSLDFRVRMVEMQHDWSTVGTQKQKIVDHRKKKTGEPIGDLTDEQLVVAKCPSCGDTESPTYIWHCASEEMRAVAELGHQEFKEFIKPVKTSPLLLKCLKARLGALWYCHPGPTRPGKRTQKPDPRSSWRTRLHRMEPPTERAAELQVEAGETGVLLKMLPQAEDPDPPALGLLHVARPVANIRSAVEGA